MLTQRAYLVSLGLAKDGRGKFSNAAKDALAKAIEQGLGTMLPRAKAITTLSVPRQHGSEMPMSMLAPMKEMRFARPLRTVAIRAGIR
jgi:hypothetical protein